MASCASNIIRLLEDELKNQPKQSIALTLRERGTVESLTEVKVILGKQASESIENFPEGDLFIRRKPRGKSAFNSIEERLAEDVAELFICLDTGVVTPEVKAMFKLVGTESSQRQEDSSVEVCFTPTESASHVDGLHSRRVYTGCCCGEELAKIKADFVLFRECMMENILKLTDRATKLEKLLDLQDEQITNLLKLSETQMAEIKKLKRVSVLKLNLNTLRENNVSPLNVLSPEDCGEKISEAYENEITDKSPIGPEVADLNVTTHTQSRNNRACFVDNTATELLYSEAVKSTMESDQIVYQQRLVPYSATNLSASIADLSKVIHNKGNDERLTEEDGFIGVQRKQNNTKRFFISGIDEKVDAQSVSCYLKSRNVRVTLLRLFKSKRKGTVSAKLNIRAEDSGKILQEDFWPQYVRCRIWLSKAKMEKKIEQSARQNQHGNRAVNQGVIESTLV